MKAPMDMTVRHFHELIFTMSYCTASQINAVNANVCDLPHCSSGRVAHFSCALEFALTGGTLGIALGNNALAEPLGGEAAVESLEVGDDVAAALDNDVLGGDATVRGDAKLERGEERVGNLVGGEGHSGVLEKALREHVG